MKGQRAYHLFRGNLGKDAVGVLLLHALDDALHLRLLGRTAGQHPCRLWQGCLSWRTCTSAERAMEGAASHTSAMGMLGAGLGRSPFPQLHAGSKPQPVSSPH